MLKLKEIKSKAVSYENNELTVTINKKTYSLKVKGLNLENKNFMYKQTDNDITLYIDDGENIKQYKLLSNDDLYKTKELKSKDDYLASLIANDKFRYDRTEEEYESICKKFDSDIFNMLNDMVNHNKKTYLKVFNQIEEHIDKLNLNLIVNKMDIYEDDLSRNLEEQHFYTQEKVLYNKFIDSVLKNNNYHKLEYDGIDFNIISEQRELKSIMTSYKIKKLEEKFIQKLNDPVIIETFEHKRKQNVEEFFNKNYDYDSVRRIIEVNSKFVKGNLVELQHFNVDLMGVYKIDDFLKRTNITRKELDYVLDDSDRNMYTHVYHLNMWSYEEKYTYEKNKDVVRIIFDKINNAFMDEILDKLNSFQKVRN